jgi:hypothetical protein
MYIWTLREFGFQRNLHFNFCIDSCNELSSLKNASRNIGSFLINPQLKCFEIFPIFLWIATMTPKENRDENLHGSISGIIEKKIMGTHYNALFGTSYKED